MPFEKGNKLAKGRKRTDQILPFTAKNICEHWNDICDYLANPDVPEAEKMNVRKWLFPLMCAYQFGKPTEKVEHSGGLTITVKLEEKAK